MRAAPGAASALRPGGASAAALALRRRRRRRRRRPRPLDDNGVPAYSRAASVIVMLRLCREQRGWEIMYGLCVIMAVLYAWQGSKAMEQRQTTTPLCPALPLQAAPGRRSGSCSVGARASAPGPATASARPPPPPRVSGAPRPSRSRGGSRPAGAGSASAGGAAARGTRWSASARARLRPGGPRQSLGAPWLRRARITAMRDG